MCNFEICCSASTFNFYYVNFLLILFPSVLLFGDYLFPCVLLFGDYFVQFCNQASFDISYLGLIN